MIIQKSFDQAQPTLYIVATPIGNRDEMTPRAIAVLKEVDVIACEDTRTSRPFLQSFDIDTKCIAYHMHNERASAQGILALLEEGKSVALISDAGYPLISDPGSILVETITQAGIPVVPVSGASAFLNALVVSGLDTSCFRFGGFLEHKETAMKKQLLEVKPYKDTLIYYVSVHRIEKSLNILLEILGDRTICLARELTKRYESILRGKISEVIHTLDVLKGEFVLVIEGNTEATPDVDIMAMIEKKRAEGISTSRAIAAVAKETGLAKNSIYQTYMAQEDTMSVDN